MDGPSGGLQRRRESDYWMAGCSEPLQQLAAPRVSRPGCQLGSEDPTEAVVVCISICYDNDPTAAVNKGLWANFSAESAEGAGPKTIADVAAHLSSVGASLASATLSQLARRGHNVAVVVPSTARALRVLSKTDHVEPFRAMGADERAAGSTVVVQSDPRVAPTGPVPFPAANARLGSFPTTTSPRPRVTAGQGSLREQAGGPMSSEEPQHRPRARSSLQSSGRSPRTGSFGPGCQVCGPGSTSRFSPRGTIPPTSCSPTASTTGGFVPAVIERNGRESEACARVTNRRPIWGSQRRHNSRVTGLFATTELAARSPAEHGSRSCQRPVKGRVS